MDLRGKTMFIPSDNTMANINCLFEKEYGTMAIFYMHNLNKKFPFHASRQRLNKTSKYLSLNLAYSLVFRRNGRVHDQSMARIKLIFFVQFGFKKILVWPARPWVNGFEHLLVNGIGSEPIMNVQVKSMFMHVKRII